MTNENKGIKKTLWIPPDLSDEDFLAKLRKANDGQLPPLWQKLKDLDEPVEDEDGKPFNKKGRRKK